MPDTSIAHATEHANDKSYQDVDSDAAPAEEQVAGLIPQAELAAATFQEPVRHQQLMTETPDWELFLEPEKLQQKAGCQPHRLRQLVLREIVDNALDVGAQVTLHQEGDAWVVTDNGPGLHPEMVPELFAVNRPLRSNKARRPLRGMLGNGLRVVMGAAVASEGSLVVETRGRRMTLGVNQATGDTTVTVSETIAMSPGLVVRITFGPGLPKHPSFDDARLAREAIRISTYGSNYNGSPSPWWYSAKNLHSFMRRIPSDTTVSSAVRDLGLVIDDNRIARSIDPIEVGKILTGLRSLSPKVKPDKLGAIGPEAYKSSSGYSRSTNRFTRERGIDIPYVAECWANCERSDEYGVGDVDIRCLLLNRTPSLAPFYASWEAPKGIDIFGCGLDRKIDVDTGKYTIFVSIITPHIELAGDSKEPVLGPFSEGLFATIQKACRAAYRAMSPVGRMSLKDAAEQVIPEAYDIASSGGTLPAKARQIMYQARPLIIELTGETEFDDTYFTQKLLPNYINDHPESQEWNIAYDQRGSFAEPHTGKIVPLGTLEVREYLGERQSVKSPAAIDPGLMSNTTGPKNRYSNILFIEKQGFDTLFAETKLAERFDIGIMSTKGMSVIAARELLDKLASSYDKVLVMHDFDVSGFTIFGSLSKSNRRYTFQNAVNVIDIGLRLSDVEEMDLDPEPYDPIGKKIKDDDKRLLSWQKRSATLKKHGAAPEEIDYLRKNRVELNAMPSRMLMEFVERKLIEHGVQKVIPDTSVLADHARHILERAMANDIIEKNRKLIEGYPDTVQLPADLYQQVLEALEANPEQPWDLAVADIANRLMTTDND